ncbi:hypothetical protein T07_2036 [Trichinella nelsoni]|uniref:Uncharacterized protein n=1 Tax=Trichinella nelsoni TaxID=6336 RepID=A0A0V0RMV6_9BILA|nr:hypothetical protein T07_2036 [Trichinella nelsoni]
MKKYPNVTGVDFLQSVKMSRERKGTLGITFIKCKDKELGSCMLRDQLYRNNQARANCHAI